MYENKFTAVCIVVKFSDEMILLVSRDNLESHIDKQDQNDLRLLSSYTKHKETIKQSVPNYEVKLPLIKNSVPRQTFNLI